jgi:hypothetical protein
MTKNSITKMTNLFGFITVGSRPRPPKFVQADPKLAAEQK